ncbi:hypothetical protein Dtox_2925 [Desulfofarcimen acetoxidans DSM 771]|jgi:hypothetical protein|uniref:Uncharacterized protein n=1 Tax=Desulfofarcimen acetoxidans (strain ATCC 49208 / DSM 771 / KCTC 5769 / VKM B-1644 / 5575) TaxID=485916 RepID=C8W2J7_DESAS|nr:hypothetical protein [Desulfofarcimen acetoxidans]ACV63681.1 hypothetical protein Dtox_2925 [Desulfofarcimen acetoxidans DSM 771]
MHLVKKCFSGFTKRNPHTKKVMELKTQLKSYQELSSTAYTLGEVEAYKAVQSLYKETYMELLAISFCENLYSLLPHILCIWLLSFIFSEIIIGSYRIGILLWYPAAIILYKATLKLIRAVLVKNRTI